MAKKALLVGINYPGTSHELHGCVNDVTLMQTMLSIVYGFNENEIKKLINEQATTANILHYLKNWLTDNPQPGDELFFHYSGHGSQLPDYSDEYLETDGLDEVIIPIDINWRDKIIKDDDLKEIFNKLPPTVKLTVVLDSCNSGSGLDQANRYVPPSNSSKKENKVIPYQRARYLAPPTEIYEEALSLQKARNKRSKIATSDYRQIDTTGMLISGCQSNQTSADAYFNSKYAGACTMNLTDIVFEHGPTITYKELIDILNFRLDDQGFSQNPELNGNQNLFNDLFLIKSTEEPVVETVEEPVIETVEEPIKEKPEKDKKNNIKLIIGFILFIILIVVFHQQV